MSGAIGSTSGRPPRFLADENLEKAIVVGLRQKRPDMTIVTTHQAGVAGLKDPQLLQRAKELDLILSTHDRKTMYDHFADFLMRLPAGEYSPGVMLVS